MRKIIASSAFFFAVALVSVSSAQEMTVVKAKGLKTFNDSISYAVGQSIYTEWLRQGVMFSVDKVSQALQNAEKGNIYFTQEQMESLMVRYQNQMNEKMKKDCEANIAAGKAYMEKIRNNKSVYTTESGLSYIRKKAGNGKKPTATDKVKVHYTGKLIDGKWTKAPSISSTYPTISPTASARWATSRRDLFWFLRWSCWKSIRNRVGEMSGFQNVVIRLSRNSEIQQST